MKRTFEEYQRRYDTNAIRCWLIAKMVDCLALQGCITMMSPDFRGFEIWMKRRPMKFSLTPYPDQHPSGDAVLSEAKQEAARGVL